MADRIGDKTDELEGKIEEVAGQVAGNERWVAEGKRRQAQAHEPSGEPPAREDER
ncbi:CsbD family protein [Amycolatopsis sp. lyj-346]|uniref:CsbD family protein n=1 Tax=Amycolatopsis sp. lyj-346 TaxID=2789289 RepID=UPI00397D650A